MDDELHLAVCVQTAVTPYLHFSLVPLESISMIVRRCYDHFHPTNLGSYVF